MKNMKIFGKKIPILAVMAVLLLVGTVSAALFAHYATLNGDIEVTSDVWVSDDNGDIELNGSGELNFSSPATFKIHNDGDVPVLVDITSTVTMPSSMPGADPDDYSGIYVDSVLVNFT